MDENWPAGDNVFINPYTSVGQIPLHDITTSQTKLIRGWFHLRNCVEPKV